MRTWFTNNWLLLVALLALAYMAVTPVAQAAQDDACKQVATAGNITIFLCQPEGAPSFLQNSYGFMTLVE